MFNNPYVEVACDGEGCHTVEIIECRSDSAMNREVESLGWTVVGDLHYCEYCSKEVTEEDFELDNLKEIYEKLEALKKSIGRITDAYEISRR